ncbi:MAG: hypothetical protein RML92_03895 [Bacteroidia bacterium]|nr:hypothetical protein [Bacteroidia bacterium]
MNPKISSGIVGLAFIWAQNFGIGTNAPTERLDVDGGRLRVRAYSGTGTRLATVDPTGVFGTIAGNANGDILQWNGTSWVPATLPSPTVQVQAPLQGNGTTANPITFAAGTAAGQVWQWNGTSWVLATIAGDNWGSQTAVTSGPIIGNGTAGNPIRLQAGGAAPQILLWNPLTSQWQLSNIPVQNGLTFNIGVPAIELGGPLIQNTDIPLSGFNLTFSGATGNIGIGTTTPTERLHVQGNLRLQGAFMPNNNAGTTGSLLLSAGTGTPPVWLAPGTSGTVLTSQGAGNNPVWQPIPSPFCATATTNRFAKFSSTTQACNTTLAENASNQIWNQGDGPAVPLYAGDKLTIVATATNPWAVNAYASVGGTGGAAFYGENSSATGTGLIVVGNGVSPFLLINGSGGAFTGSEYALYARANNTTGDRAAGFFSAAPNNTWLVGAVIAGVATKIAGPGVAATLVSTPAGGFRDKIMFAPEAPEILLMDFGKGKLIDGRAYISLDPIFSHNIIVDDRHDLRVYIQLEGDCEGVYVTNKSDKGFEVRELRGGRSNVSFSWFVVANRKDEIDPNSGEVIAKYQDVRFLPMPSLPTSVQVRKSRSQSENR